MPLRRDAKRLPPPIQCPEKMALSACLLLCKRIRNPPRFRLGGLPTSELVEIISGHVIAVNHALECVESCQILRSQ